MESKPNSIGSNIVWTNEYGQWHREDGPAFIGASGLEEWYFNHKLHRLDGPAVIDPDGLTFWYINGWCVEDDIHEWAEELGIDLKNLTEDDKLLLYMKWHDL